MNAANVSPEAWRGGVAAKRHFETQRPGAASGRNQRNLNAEAAEAKVGRKGPEGFMRNARKQERPTYVGGFGEARTRSLNLFSCLPVFLIQSVLRFGRLKIYSACIEIEG